MVAPRSCPNKDTGKEFNSMQGKIESKFDLVILEIRKINLEDSDVNY